MSWFSSNAPTGMTGGKIARSVPGLSSVGRGLVGGGHGTGRGAFTAISEGPVASRGATILNAPDGDRYLTPEQAAEYRQMSPERIVQLQAEANDPTRARNAGNIAPGYLGNVGISPGSGRVEGSASIPGGGAAQQYGDPFRQKIADSLMQGYGRVDPAQVEYYVRQKAQSAAEGDPRDDDYWAQRAMGWQAGGADVATQGPYAGGGQNTSSYGGQPNNGGLPAGYSLNGANHLSSFAAPGLAAPWTEQFNRPNPNDISNTPAYQFRMGQGTDAIQKSAAAKGTLLTGGTLKDLTNFAQGLASTEYDKEYGRDLGEYQMNMGTFRDNQNGAYNKLAGIANTGANAASSYANNVGDLYQQGGAIDANAANAQNAGWQNTFSNLADTGTSLYKAYLARRKGQGAIGSTALPKPISQGDALAGGDYA